MAFRKKMEVNRFWFFCFICSTLSAFCDNADGLTVRVTPTEVMFPEGDTPSVDCRAQGGIGAHYTLDIDFYWFHAENLSSRLTARDQVTITLQETGVDGETGENFQCNRLTFHSEFWPKLRSRRNYFECKTVLYEDRNMTAHAKTPFYVIKMLAPTSD